MDSFERSDGKSWTWMERGRECKFKMPFFFYIFWAKDYNYNRFKLVVQWLLWTGARQVVELVENCGVIPSFVHRDEVLDWARPSPPQVRARLDDAHNARRLPQSERQSQDKRISRTSELQFFLHNAFSYFHCVVFSFKWLWAICRLFLLRKILFCFVELIN